MQSRLTALFAAVLATAFLPSPLCAAQKTVPPRVDVILWFDTEDYLLPADDEACLRLATMMRARGIRATFKVVGEKARVLAQRGRRDVIKALGQHDIGYHSDFHSVHPTPTEYLAECGLLDGMAEFARREGDGAADVRRIFGVKTLSCYGQPGSSWGPQTMAALPQIGVAPSGVPCYVDEGSHIGLNNKPFWYANTLTVFNMGRGRGYTRMELHDPAAVEPAKREFTEMARRLAQRDGGGLISIFYHPCEWVHQQFWDGVNFARGANPPREEWKPPAPRTAAETDAAFARFGQYLDHLRATPGVRFVTASELPAIYPDPARESGLAEAELNELARRILAGTNGLNFQILAGKALSPADQFELLTQAIGQLSARKKLTFPLPARGLLGPDAPAPASAPTQRFSWMAFRDAAIDARQFIETQRRVPARVFLGTEAVAPADFLIALAGAWELRSKSGELPRDGVVFTSGTRLLTESQVARDTPGLFGGWVIHKEGFRAPKVLEVARLQAWTLKPALRKD